MSMQQLYQTISDDTRCARAASCVGMHGGNGFAAQICVCCAVRHIDVAVLRVPSTDRGQLYHCA